MPTKPPSWKSIAEQRRKDNFVGRTDQLRVFQENFAGETPNWMVLSITGEGGVGKSTLLKRYSQLAESPEINANVVICDDHHLFPVDVMGAIAEQLDKLGIDAKFFSDRYKKYRELCQQIESDPNAPRSMVNVITHGLTDFAIKSLRRAPAIGVAMDYVDEKAAGDALVELAQYTVNRWSNKDEIQLVREPEKILTPLFVELLGEAAVKKRLVVIFDVFERTSGVLSPWLLSLFGSQYGEFSSQVLFILSGRDPLEQHWTELSGLLTHMQLEPFTLEETTLYLSNQRITDPNLINLIHQDTGGLPVLVELLAGANPKVGEPLPDYSFRAVERFFQWTSDESKRLAASLAAIPRQFNKDILSVLLGIDCSPLFNWLISQSYIRSNSERGFFYHEKVRMLMIRYQKNTAPIELSRNNVLLAEYFIKLQSELKLYGKNCYESREWRRWELERVHHRLNAVPEQGFIDLLNAFLAAFLYRRNFAAVIAQIALQGGFDSAADSIKQNINKLLELVNAYNNDEYRQIISILNVLQETSNLNRVSQMAIFYVRGDCYFFLDEYDKALADFTSVMGLDEDYFDALSGRGVTYKQIGMYNEAINDFTRAIELGDNTAYTISSRGGAYREIGKYNEALADFRRAIELDDKDPWSITGRGATYLRMGKYNEALADFIRAIELDDKYIWAITNRGKIYQLMGKYNEAVADFTRTIELDEKYIWAISSRGKTYQQMGNYNEAVADFSRAIELDEKDIGSIWNRGETYRLVGKYEEALADFDRANTLDEKYIWAIASRGLTYQQIGKYNEALVDFSRAIELDEKYAWAKVGRGITYQRMGKNEESLVDFDQAIALDEKYAWAILNRGETYRKIGEHKKAISDFTYALELDPLDTFSLTRRAATYIAIQNMEAAQTDLSEAMSLLMDDDSGLYDKVIILILNNRHQEAIESLKLAFEREPSYRFYAQTDDLLNPLRNILDFQVLMKVT